MYDPSTLGPEEFNIEMLDRISKKIVSRNYLRHHKEFVDSFIFDLFPAYVKGYDLNTLAEIAESMFFNIFQYRPATENMEEIITID